MSPARVNLRWAAKTGKTVALYIAGALAGTGLYAANLVYLHNRVDATLVASLPVREALTSVAISPDGDTLAVGANQAGALDRATTRLWNISDPASPVKVGQTPTSTHIVNRVAFTPDGAALATNDANAVTLWDLAERDDGYSVKPTNPHHPSTSKVRTTLVSDGQVPTAGYAAGKITLWDAAHPAHPVQVSQPRSVRSTKNHLPSAAFTPDGQTLAFATGDGRLTLRKTGNPAHPLSRLPAISTKGDWVNSVAFFPGGKTLAAGSYNNTVTLWNVDNPAHPVKVSQPLTGSGTVTVTEHHGVYETNSPSDNTVSVVAISPDGETLAVCHGDGTITLWNVTDPAQPVRVGQPIKANETLNSVAFTPDGKNLVTGSFKGTTGAESRVNIWRI